MLFSIVTPAYNAAPYIGELIRRIAAQSFDGWEMIIVDDASSDDTLAVASAAIGESGLADRFSLLQSESNSGSDFAPRARAMRAARGEYLVNIDADDLVEPDYLHHIADRIAATGADIVYAAMSRFSTPGDYSPFLPTKAFVESGKAQKVMPGKMMISHTLDGWEVTGVGATRRTIALRSLDNFKRLMANPPGRDGFDNENLTRLDLFMAPSATFALSALYRYRHVASSITGGVSPRFFSILDADRRLAAFILDSYGYDSEEYGLAERQLFHHYIESLRMTAWHPDLLSVRTVCRQLREARMALDTKRVRPLVSGKLFALLPLPIRIAGLILKTYDRITGKR